MVLGQIVGAGQTMAAAADNDCVIFGFWFGVPPRKLPVPVAGQAVADQVGKRIAAHWPDPKPTVLENLSGI